MFRLLTIALTTMLLLPALCRAHDGPHGGELYCNEKHSHHAELCVDVKTGKATVYILDKKGKKEVPIAAETIQVTLKGLDKPLKLAAQDVRDGKSSKFIVTHEKFKGKLKPSDAIFQIVLETGKPAVDFLPEHDDDE